MDNLPFTVLLEGGEKIQVFPNRTLAAVAAGDDATDVWHIDADGLIEKVTIQAELKYIRDALELD